MPYLGWKRLLPVLVAIVMFDTGPSVAEEFDPEAWRSAGGTDASFRTRRDMVPGVVERVTGLSRIEAHEILGEPDEVLGEDDTWYVMRDVMFSQHRVLLIEYDEAGTVARARDVSTETWR
ncbi:hypothetical protein RM543_10585 [Roseicyclus sp. F158]|uniref:Outer membrane protein assembly factor BamE n=1 Tax=Tropicimonas omnivorans TaxID=3075590 RepID=A0ABU3DHE7_9RHOB|nr:hypothetical protein [Roseicyclus sp. F158]MDT0683133.1 hypothetical protein [Roseicyclus sp. F158]